MNFCSCNCKKEIIDKTCPLCKTKVKPLHYMALKPVIKEELQKFIYKGQYYMCNNKNCDVVFFDEKADFIFLTRDINMAADFQQVSNIDKDFSPTKCKGCSDSKGGE